MKFKKINHNLAFNIVAAVVLLLIVFGGVLSVIGYFTFTKNLTNQYIKQSYAIADLSSAIVDGDKIDYYLTVGEDDDSYKLTQSRLDVILEKQACTLIYVIKVDTSDYQSFLSIFNSVQEGHGYTRWELGASKYTTNDDYANIYRRLYAQETEREYIVRNKNLRGKEAHITSLVPIKGSDGEVKAILCVQTPMSELTAGRSRYLRIVITWIIITLVGISAVYFVFVKNQFVKPLHKVTKEANRFALDKDGSEKIELSNISKINEIAVLAKSITQMEEDINKYIEEVKTITADKNRIAMELNVANVIQSNAVPNTFPAFPDRTDFDIYASMTPAKEVGGDFYNYFMLDDDHLFILIGDVSGKGIGASLFMMVSMILIDDRALLGGTPAEIMSFVNNRIVQKNEANLFVTVWAGIVTLSTGEVVACNAGHDDPVLYKKNGEFELIKSKHGIVVGAFEGYQYKDYTFKMDKGDKLFVYTDGIPEATNAYKQMFTIDKMVESLNSHKDENPQGVCEGIIDDVNKFVNGSEQFDDMTMVCFEYDDQQVSNEKELVVKADTSNLDKVNSFILNGLDLNPKTEMQITLSVEEIFVNIANYAYGDKGGDATIKVKNEDNELSISFMDSGTPYNPLDNNEPDITLDAKDRPIGGLGIFLVKKNMDSVEYEYKDNKNILTMTKKLQ